MLRLAAIQAVMLCAVMFAGAQEMPAGFPEKITEAPAVLPRGCPPALVDGLRTIKGTPGYQNLHREMATLKLAHTASQQLQAALAKHGEKEGDQLREIIQVMTGLEGAKNMYLCASYVAGLPMNGDSIATKQRDAMVSVYNRMALHASQLANALSTEAARARAATTTQNDDSKQLAVIMEGRKKAGSDLVDIMTRGVLQVIDTDDARGARPDKLRITCPERDRLLNEAAPLAKSEPVDEFTIASGLIQDFLKRPYKCVP